jgi:ABC-type branched-subunit amino acid transport system substrate-binding protein
MTVNRLSAGLVALACAALVSACGSGAVQTTVGAGAHSHLHGPAIELMVAGDLSSPAAIPEVPTGAEAAVAALNASGGIDGRPVHLIVCDDNDPSPTACARRAVAAHVAATVGSMSAGIDPILLANGIAQVGNVPFVAGDYTAPNSFPLFGFVTASGGIIKELAAAGCHRVAPMVLAGESSGDDANRYLHLAQTTTPGVTVLPAIPVPFGLPDLSAQLAKATGDGSDCIAAILRSSDVAKVLVEAQEQGVKEKFGFGESSVSQDLVTQLKGASEGIYVAGGFRALSSENPAVAQFKAQMARYQPQAELDNFSENSWAAVKLFEIAATNALGRYHAIDARSIYATMKTLSDVNLGICAPVSFTRPGGLPDAPRVVDTNVFFTQVRHGVITDLSETPHSVL